MTKNRFFLIQWISWFSDLVLNNIHSFHSTSQLSQRIFQLWQRITPFSDSVNHLKRFISFSFNESTELANLSVITEFHLSSFTSISFSESVELVNLSIITKFHLFLIQRIRWVSESFIQWISWVSESFVWIFYDWDLLHCLSANQLHQWIFLRRFLRIFPRNPLLTFSESAESFNTSIVCYLLQTQMSQSYSKDSKLDCILIFIFLVSVLYWDHPPVINIQNVDTETSLIFDLRK